MDVLILAFFLHLGGSSLCDEAVVSASRHDGQETKWRTCGEAQLAGCLRELVGSPLEWDVGIQS